MINLIAKQNVKPGESGFKKIMVTGSCGFIGSNFVRRVCLKYPQYHYFGVDKLVKSENINNMFSTNPIYNNFYMADIADKHAMERIFEIEKPDYVINFAAESFVDNSITNITPFLHTNILGTQVIIDCCLKYKTELLLHISTDEVYGQKLKMDEMAWSEHAPIAARNPYASSKACSELIIRSAHETHGLQYKMTRSCNVFGPRQKHDNLIPHVITQLMKDEPVYIHGNGENFRQYIYVDDNISGTMKVLEDGEMNEVYNIGDYNYFTNLQMVENIGRIMGKNPEIKFVEDRKAHDFGYKVSNAKLQYLDWHIEGKFFEKLENTVKWYMNEKK